MRALLGYKPLANLQLDEIDGEHIAQFVAHRQSLGLQVSYVNGSVRALRRMLRLAVEWGVLEVAPRVEMLPGEHRRERVVTPEERTAVPVSSAHLDRADRGRVGQYRATSQTSATGFDGKTSRISRTLGVMGRTRLAEAVFPVSDQ
jgi:hypothetical protein